MELIELVLIRDMLQGSHILERHGLPEKRENLLLAEKSEDIRVKEIVLAVPAILWDGVGHLDRHHRRGKGIHIDLDAIGVKAEIKDQVPEKPEHEDKGNKTRQEREGENRLEIQKQADNGHKTGKGCCLQGSETLEKIQEEENENYREKIIGRQAKGGKCDAEDPGETEDNESKIQDKGRLGYL